eukprot:TRINITY_DN9508_c0_g1_i2.p2 TRINITY_DN9508_c0_g1~~TRINITY_DN9508_c0_g1_i2.p2  ORF type:complete len:248 (+),score=31.98 TRINITY_DN9508_c0_g1_i2:1042-1785(+)
MRLPASCITFLIHSTMTFCHVEDWPIAKLGDVDVMSPAGFQQTQRWFCLDGRDITEVPEHNTCQSSIVAAQSWGSLGLSCVVWPAATFLARHLIDTLQGNEVMLELGAGTGFVGLAARQQHPRLHVMLSDRELALSCMRDNLIANGNFTNVHVTTLDWFQPLPKLPLQPTLIVAADVVYEQSLFQPLIATITSLLRTYPSARMLLAAQQRYPKRLRTFLRLAKAELNVHLVAVETQTRCKLFELTMK